MKRRVVLSMALLASACAQSSPVPARRAVVFFMADNAGLDASAQGAIRQAALDAQTTPGTVVHVLGFAAPDTGTVAFNRSLAQTRAQAVADGLVAAGVAPARIRIEARGAVPYADVAMESRRVEIVVGP